MSHDTQQMMETMHGFIEANRPEAIEITLDQLRDKAGEMGLEVFEPGSEMPVEMWDYLRGKKDQSGYEQKTLFVVWGEESGAKSSRLPWKKYGNKRHFEILAVGENETVKFSYDRNTYAHVDHITYSPSHDSCHWMVDRDDYDYKDDGNNRIEGRRPYYAVWEKMRQAFGIGDVSMKTPVGSLFMPVPKGVSLTYSDGFQTDMWVAGAGVQGELVTVEEAVQNAREFIGAFSPILQAHILHGLQRDIAAAVENMQVDATIAQKIADELTPGGATVYVEDDRLVFGLANGDKVKVDFSHIQFFFADEAEKHANAFVGEENLQVAKQVVEDVGTYYSNQVFVARGNLWINMPDGLRVKIDPDALKKVAN